MNTPAITVRRTTASDFDALLAMKHDPDDIKWSGFACAPEPASFRQWFDGALTDPHRWLFVATINGAAVGYCNWRQDGKSFEASNGTLPEHRGKGIAKIMRTFSVQEILKAIPDAHIEAWIASTNYPARRSLSLQGFMQDGQFKEVSFLYPEPRTEVMFHYIMTGQHVL